MRAYIVVQQPDHGGNVQLVGDDAEQHTVDPVTMPPVRASAHSLADEAAPFSMSQRPGVEAVDLELQPVVAEIAHEVLLEQARGIVGDAPAAERRMDSQSLEVRDARAAVRQLESHCTGTFAVDVDHEPAEVVRLALRSFDLHCDCSAILRSDRAEERFHLLVSDELEEEVHVAGRRTTNRDRHGVWVTGARRGRRATPDATATPRRMSAMPPTSPAVSGSPSSVAP